MNKNESKLKQTGKKIFVKASVGVLALLIAGGAMYSAHAKNVETERQTVRLSSQESVDALARKYGVEDMLAHDEDGYIRFEIAPNTPINVIVDQGAGTLTSTTNEEAIKLAIGNLNEAFAYINPNYSFRYITRNDFEKLINKDPDIAQNPCIFVTTQLRIERENGTAVATTHPLIGPAESRYGNGTVSHSSRITLNALSMSDMSLEEQSAAVIHELFHALGIITHFAHEDAIGNPSIMSKYATKDSLLSDEASLDALICMCSLYYNSENNPHTLAEVMEYLTAIAIGRKQEIAENKKLRDLPTYHYITNGEYSPEKYNYALNYNYYAHRFDENLKDYAEGNKLKVLTPNLLIGTSYSSTSIYGQTKTITLNPDNTYTLHITNSEIDITLKGTYVIEGNFITCTGDNMILVDDHMHIGLDNICLALMSNGKVVMGSTSGTLNISSTLTYHQPEQEMNR